MDFTFIRKNPLKKSRKRVEFYANYHLLNCQYLTNKNHSFLEVIKGFRGDGRYILVVKLGYIITAYIKPQRLQPLRLFLLCVDIPTALCIINLFIDQIK
nr:MAG TPA: hypothetical protein [Caudoviricetes sp.]